MTTPATPPPFIALPKPAINAFGKSYYSAEQMMTMAREGIAVGMATAAAKPKKPRATKAEALRPADVPEPVWVDFIALRKAKSAPLTQTALKLIAKDAEKAGYTLAAALEICCARGWQAFRADWVRPQRAAPGILSNRNYGTDNGYLE